MKIRILTDSASDITLEELKENNVGLIPMPLLCGDETHIDDKKTSMEVFWKMLAEGIDIKTSQPSPETFIKAFEDAKNAGDAVICILIASKLSGTYQCALLARSMVDYEHIYVIDSKNAAASEKMLVYHACRLRDTTDMTAAEIAKELESFRSRIRLLACLDTLEYLARGGRLPKTAANIGTVMKVKPIITIVEDGEIKVVKKVIGQQRAMNEMVSEVMGFEVSDEHPVIPIYAHDSSNCTEYVKKLKEAGIENKLVSSEEAGFENKTENLEGSGFENKLVNPKEAGLGSKIKAPEPIGATIGTYIGPGAYGIVFMEK